MPKSDASDGVASTTCAAAGGVTLHPSFRDRG